jgi:uncharacterized membrane protein YraQ (UPF0718 family)
MIKQAKKIPAGIRFLIFIIIVYVVTYFFNPSFIKNSVANFMETLLQLLPILGIVFIAIFFINIFLKPEKIKKHLGYDSGIKGWFYTGVASVLFIGPPYVMFPLLGELKNHGMKYSLLAFFLGNRNVKPVFLPVMIYYFGTLFTIVISFYIIIFAMLTGVIMGRIMQESGNISN